MKSIKCYFPAALLLCALLVSVRALTLDFAFDDYPRILENEQIRSLSNLPSIFLSASWPGNLYRPIDALLNTVAYSIVEYEAFLYHLISITIHILCVLVLFAVLKKLFDSNKAFLVALLFAVHPLHSEVIASASYRSESLAVLFILLTCLVAIYIQEQNKVSFFSLLALGISFLFALLSKESGLHAIPLSLLCIWYYKNDSDYSRKYIPVLSGLAITLVIYLGLRYFALNQQLFISEAVPMHDNPMVKLTSGMQIWNGLIYLGKYLVLCIVPFDISAVSTYPKIIPAIEISRTTTQAWLYLVLLTIFAVVTLKGIRSRSNYSFWGLWFFLSFLLTANVFITIGTIFADRLAYLGSIAGCGVIAEVLFKLTEKQRLPATSIIILFFFAATFFTIGHWKNNYSLFEFESRNSPKSSLARRMYGEELFKQKRYEEAIFELENAYHLYKYCITPMKYLALSYYELNNQGKAAHWALRYKNVNAADNENLKLIECLKSETSKNESSECASLVPKYIAYLIENPGLQGISIPVDNL